MPPYKKIGITVKSDIDERDEAVKKVLHVLQKEGVEICMDAKRCKDLPSAKGLPRFEREPRRGRFYGGDEYDGSGNRVTKTPAR